VGEHRRTGHLGAKLSGGEAQGKSQRCAAETESERGMSRSETKPQRTKQKRDREPRLRLIGQREISENAGGEQHRQPEEPAILLGFECTG
jgi:hypothetical protein